MAQPVPTLSSKGWLYGPAEKADYLMAYFFISDYSQSYAHLGNVKSLPYLIRQTTGDHRELPSLIISSLGSLLSAYFDSANVECSIPNINDPTTAQLEVRVIATVSQDGKNYSLGKLVSFVDSKFLNMKAIKT